MLSLVPLGTTSIEFELGEWDVYITDSNVNSSPPDEVESKTVITEPEFISIRFVQKTDPRNHVLFRKRATSDEISLQRSVRLSASTLLGLVDQLGDTLHLSEDLSKLDLSLHHSPERNY